MTMESEREREFKICAAENWLLLIKILSEEVSFKAGFEGREGRAMTESEMKRIPDLCRREADLLGYVGLSLVQSDCGNFQTFTDRHLPGCWAIFPGVWGLGVGLLLCFSFKQVSCQLALTGLLSTR